MRRPFITFLVISMFFLNACGLEDRAYNNTMTEQQAMDVLIDVPMLEGGRNIRGDRSDVSAEGLVALLQELVESGDIQVSNNVRGALFDGGTGGLGMLTDIFSLVQGGQADSVWGLAEGLLNLNGGDPNTAGGELDGILDLINAALPIIAIFAPEFVPIVQALIVIVPLVLQIINLVSTLWGAVYNPALLAIENLS